MDDNNDRIVADLDWVVSGWTDVLPHQANSLHSLVATATARDVDGSLDALSVIVGCGWFDDATGGLDSPIRWIHSADIGDPESEALAQRLEFACVRTFAKARIPVPDTVRDLAYTMASLGLFALDDSVPRWRTVARPLLPAEVLPIDDERRADQDQRRWTALHESAALDVSRFLSRAGSGHRPVATSVAQLSASTDYGHDSIRAALEVLCRYQAIDIELLDGTRANPERLGATTSFVVVSLDFLEVPSAPED